MVWWTVACDECDKAAHLHSLDVYSWHFPFKPVACTFVYYAAGLRFTEL
jgi:hypothetical protein